MNPKELQEKALSLLQPLVVEAYQMILKPKAKMPKDSQFCSHFNGNPYFEPGEQWPMAAPKKPYDFIFQVVNDGTFGLPKNIAVFQFYYEWEMMPCSTKEKGWLVKTYSKMDRTNGITIDIPTEVKERWEFGEETFNDTRKYCNITFKPICMLPAWDSIDDYVPKKELIKLCDKINEDEPWEAYTQLRKKLKTETDVDSCYGGYPQWIQGNELKGHKLAFQIGSEDQEYVGYHWVDEGRVYLFFDAKNEDAFRFVL